ncbi:MAG: glycosyltransferase family 39 protein [Chloroflexi bacterium]|nr:glycosyltransferase family 39 protein [Chloroflexota bacterium]
MKLPITLFLVALAVRAAAAMLFPDPAYPDSFYYVNVARELAAGNGLQVDYIWNFIDVGWRLPGDGSLPIPANSLWMPLASLVQVPFILALGATPLAFGLPFWLAGAAVAPLTYAIGRDARLSRSQSAAAGLLVAMPAAATPFLAQPDNFALYMLLGSLALWLCARGLRGDRRAFALGGLVVGLAALARNDGVLLGLPFALGFLYERWKVRSGASADGQAALAERTASGSQGALGWRTALACFGGFLLVTGPWFLRQLIVFGTLSPATREGHIFFLESHAALFSIGTLPTLESFLAQGPAAIVSSRVGGLVSALFLFASVPLLFYLVPFTGIGAVLRRRDPAFIPWAIYGITLVLYSALLFPVFVPHGMFMHSALALAPHAYLLAILGVSAGVGWIARRRPRWDAPRATRHLTAVVVAFALIGSAGATLRTAGAWGDDSRARLALTEALRTVPPDELVMSGDPGAYRYLAGRGGIITPDDPLPVIEAALRSYGVRWLALERPHLVPALLPVLDGESRPDWLSAPVVVVPRGDRGGLASVVDPDPGAPPLTVPPPAAPPLAALYAVCLAPSDERCLP